MKKLIAVILILTLVLGIGSMVLAGGGDPNNIIFSKSTGNLNTPNEIFEFKITKAGSSAKHNFNITTSGGSGSQSVSIASILDTFGISSTQVGQHEFTIAEEPGNTAGMNYNAASKTLIIAVLNELDAEGELTGGFVYSYRLEVDGLKSDGNFVNGFNSGTLLISKEVTGNMGDKNREFDVIITLNAASGKVVPDGTVLINGSAINFAGGTSYSTTKQIQHGDTITISNLPYGVSYTVIEDTSTLDGHTASGEVKTAETMGSASVNVNLVNNKGTTIETGISLDNLPYIMTMVLALAGIGLFLVRKRRTN